MSSKQKPRRLDQLLSSLGYCSRAQAKQWLGEGRVTVDGVPATDPSRRVACEGVLVDGQPLDHPAGIFILLHKPLGYVCSHSEAEGPTVYDLLPERWRSRNPGVTSIGRLDKETSGALLLTDQSQLVHQLTSPKRKVPKLYEVTVDRELDPGLVPKFASGTILLKDDPDPCLPAELRIISSFEAELVLTEGRYHQVRRMFASQGYHVAALHRSRFGEYELEDLPAGAFRDLSIPS